ncbi:ROK family protein [Marinilactibacillus piezotolerans]|uniref:ROK family protein n=1 Tax=Marinilactibacillus piezotolerans TaxID=258723 RepID=UPI0009B01BAE|nr:ROK family protein [Marinilactibacillus piezotolerans]
MSLLAFDIGGTSVKYAIWDEDQLKEKGSFFTPDSWDQLKSLLVQTKVSFQERFIIDGVAFSAPGAINQIDRQIEGVSEVPYIHFFPIYDELEAAFGLPVSFENDANCAGLAEIWRGAAVDKSNVLFVVLGTGIGGAIIVNGEIQHGHHLLGGEFGFMLLEGERTFSELGTAVAMARRYAKRMNLPTNEVSGEQVFQLAEAGDQVAKEEVNTFYHYLVKGLYNLAYSFDPEVLLLGGGVSNKPDLIERINDEMDALFSRLRVPPFRPVIELCQFKNDANLIGAICHYKKSHQ